MKRGSSNKKSDAGLTAEANQHGKKISSQKKSDDDKIKSQRRPNVEKIIRKLSKPEYIRKTKAKMTAADLTRETLSSEKKLREYFENLIEKVSEKVITKKGVELRVLRWLESTVHYKNYIIFVPMIFDGERVCALLRSTNLYVVGALTSDSECSVFYENDEKKGWGAKGYETFKECMTLYGITIKSVSSIKDSYTGLQQLANVTRATMKLGKNALIRAHAFLSKSDWSDRAGIAHSLLVIAQFFSEPLRIKAYAEYLCNNFLAYDGEGFDIPLIYIILQHGWGSASESLIRYRHDYPNLDVFYADNELPLSTGQLREYYGVLKCYLFDELKFPPHYFPHPQNMKSKYLWSFHEFSFLTKYYKSTIPVELTSHEEEYSVKAVKHVFDAYVVIEYTCSHKFPGVCVNVKSSGDEKHLPVTTTSIPSLQHNLERQIFVAFEKPAVHVTHVQFFNTLSFTVEKDDTVAEKNVEYKLKDLEFHATDFIQKFHIRFGEEWKEISQKYERIDMYTFLSSSPYNNLSSFMKGVTNIFGMHSCEGSEVVRQDATRHTCLLSGKYMTVNPILVKVTVKFNSVEYVQMKITYRCNDRSCGRNVHGFIRRWIFKICNVFNSDEDIYASDGESDKDEHRVVFIYGA
ncbi:hypothetical protein AgCh_026878 [Apium graveolens]